MKRKYSDEEVANKEREVGKKLLSAFQTIAKESEVNEEFVACMVLPALRYSGVMLGGNVSRELAEKSFFDAFGLGERIMGTRK